MNELCIFVGDTFAGTIKREGEALYTFSYHKGYEGPPVFLAWPLSVSERSWDQFPPALDGVLPEGNLLEQLLVTRKLDRSDKWGQLIAVGGDLTGFLSVLPKGEHPVGRCAPGGESPQRSSISPDANALPYEVASLVQFHSTRAPRMSISGVQPKVSAVFSRTRGEFQLVETNGSYILKPSPLVYPEAAQNEALTMHLARLAGLEVPPCGLLRSLDDVGVFWIERFDRRGQGNRIRLRCEDVCQLLEIPSSWKYSGEMESLVHITSRFCSNPILQQVRLFKRLLFCWITGNGDMHLKNWSLLEKGNLVEWSPVYDFLNTAILIQDEEESAVSLKGYKSGLTKTMLLDYLGAELCGVHEKMMHRVLNDLFNVEWERVIMESSLSTPNQSLYWQVVRTRLAQLQV